MTTADYLTQLEQDREDLVDNLETQGITGLTGDETFTELVPEVLNISGGGSNIYLENDVTFYDYDGTIVYSCSASDFANMTAMPSNPTHDGLTAEGWNWTLSDAKTHVSKYGWINIGQTYYPTDGKMHVFIKIDGDGNSPYLGFAINGTATIEWGDGTQDVVTGTSTTTDIYTQHTYASNGYYEIKVSSESDIFIDGAFDKGSFLLSNSSSPSTSNFFRNKIKKIILSKKCYYGGACFSRLGSLEEIILPSYSYSYTNHAYIFYYCTSLKHVNMNTVIDNFGNAFSYCCNLKSFSLNDITFSSNTSSTFTYCEGLKKVFIKFESTISSAMFNYCCGLNNITFDENITTVPGQFFRYCYALQKVVFPKSLTSIAVTNIMANAYSLKVMDFSKCTSVPTLSNSLPDTALPIDYKIIVPNDLYNTWIATNYWSTIASHIVKVSDYVE